MLHDLCCGMMVYGRTEDHKVSQYSVGWLQIAEESACALSLLPIKNHCRSDFYLVIFGFNFKGKKFWLHLQYQLVQTNRNASVKWNFCCWVRHAYSIPGVGFLQKIFTLYSWTKCGPGPNFSFTLKRIQIVQDRITDHTKAQ